LARKLVAALPSEGRVLYLAGADRKPDMEHTLTRAGFSVATVEVYAAQACPEWSDQEARAVASCRAALHYSRRSAELALAFALRAGISTHWRAMAHVAISADVAEALTGSGAVEILVALAPREEAMLAALADVARRDETSGFPSPSRSPIEITNLE
jgi:uroporphyrinogen-III synthase